MGLPDISIIGTGGLGTSLVRGLRTNKIPVKSIFNRSAEKAVALAEEQSIAHTAAFPAAADELGELVFITVSDRAIEPLASRLAALGDGLGDKTFVHCSGNESAELLQDLKTQGAQTASFHPLQTFTEISDAGSFQGIYFSLQGDKSAFSMLQRVAQQLGAEVLIVDENQKQHLHAAAVIASNYLNALLDGAVHIAGLGDLPKEKAKKALYPLVEKTLLNIGESSFEEALTGPVKRGDATTVEKHLRLLEGDEDLHALYVLLGRRTVEMAQRSGAIDGPTADQLRNVLR